MCNFTETWYDLHTENSHDLVASQFRLCSASETFSLRRTLTLQKWGTKNGARKVGYTPLTLFNVKPVILELTRSHEIS